MLALAQMGRLASDLVPPCTPCARRCGAARDAHRRGCCVRAEGSYGRLRAAETATRPRSGGRRIVSSRRIGRNRGRPTEQAVGEHCVGAQTPCGRSRPSARGPLRLIAMISPPNHPVADGRDQSRPSRRLASGLPLSSRRWWPGARPPSASTSCDLRVHQRRFRPISTSAPSGETGSRPPVRSSGSQWNPPSRPGRRGCAASAPDRLHSAAATHVAGSRRRRAARPIPPPVASEHHQRAQPDPLECSSAATAAMVSAGADREHGVALGPRIWRQASDVPRSSLLWRTASPRSPALQRTRA